MTPREYPSLDGGTYFVSVKGRVTILVSCLSMSSFAAPD